MELEKINIQDGEADSAPEGGRKINENFDKLSEALDDTVKKTGDISSTTTSIAEVPSPIPMPTGATISLLMGIIWRWITDFVTGAFIVGAASKATKDGAGRVIADTYATKEEVDQKISGVYRPCGSVQSVSALLALTGVKSGDVYDIKEAGTLAGQPVKAGDNVVALADNPSPEQWDVLSGIIDVSDKLDKTGDASNTTAAFTPASSRTNITTGENLSSLFGKIARWFADLKTAAFTGSYNDLTNRPASLPANGGNADTVDGKHASDFIPATDKGSAGGVAELDTTGKVPAAQLPLGETSNTAYPGNKGKQNADDIAALETGKLDKTGDASDTTVVFTPEAGDPVSGGKLSNIVGRVVKKISDIVSGDIAVGVAVNDSAGLHIANNYLRRTYVRPGIVWNSTGWRRIYIAGNADHPGGTVMLNITNLYSNTPPQLLSLLISTGSGGVVIQQFNASYNVPISKVRVCRKSNTPWCVDVYCNDARANYIYANQCGGDGYIVGSEMADPSIEGYTVTEYEIKAGDRLANVSQLPKVYVQSAEPAGAKEGDLWVQNVD